MSVELLVKLSLPYAGEAPGPSAAMLKAVGESVDSLLRDTSTSAAVHAHIDGNRDLGADLFALATELGWQMIAIPEACDGLGFGERGIALIAERTGAYLAPGPLTPSLIAIRFLMQFADAGLRGELLAELVSRGLRIAIPAIVDPPSPLRLTHEGASGSVRMLGDADSDYALIQVQGDDHRGWALVAIGDAATMSPGDIWDRTRTLSTLTCSAARVVALFADPDGVATDMLLIDFCLAMASESLGGATAMADRTVAYMKERQQFGLPIGAFQALKHRVADFVTRIATSRHLLEQALLAQENGAHDARMLALLSKASATDCYAFVAGDSVQLHGGVGHTWEFDVHIHVKRARLNQALVLDNNRCRDLAADALAESLA